VVGRLLKGSLSIPIFKALEKQLKYNQLRTLLKNALFSGNEISVNEAGSIAETALMHGFVTTDSIGNLKAPNKVFESFLSDMLVSKNI
jgi:hypothetical protein